MTAKKKLQLQHIDGKFLYFARAIDGTMEQGSNQLSTKSEGSEKTLITQQHFFDYYYYWNPDAVKLYKASDMILFVDSNVLYLTAPGSKSRTGGFFYLQR